MTKQQFLDSYIPAYLAARASAESPVWISDDVARAFDEAEAAWLAFERERAARRKGRARQ